MRKRIFTAKVAEVQRKWRKANRDKRLAQEARWRERRRTAADKLKDNPCLDCGQKYPPYVMQWDHRDPTDKKFTISRAVTRRMDFDLILAEIAKCDLVCANCHAERTHQWRKAKGRGR